MEIARSNGISLEWIEYLWPAPDKEVLLDKIVVVGGNELNGRVTISGAKNATLPIMAATLLAEGRFRFRNVPNLQDVRTMAKLLQMLGAEVEHSGNGVDVDTTTVNSWEAPYELVKTMRASVCVLGPLLGKQGRARVSLPGGCAWGPRPVDLHLKGMSALGADIKLEHGYIEATAPGGLKGNRIYLDKPSVGATENIMMAASCADGETVIENAAREPEITALAELLTSMGARVEERSAGVVSIIGSKNLQAIETSMIPDRIEAGTYMMAVAASRGNAWIDNCNPDNLSAVLNKLIEAGVGVKVEGRSVLIQMDGKPKAVDVTTAPYPGFPTDLQAQMMAFMSEADGASVITDTIYHDRFTHVPELRRLGADIELDANVAVVRGVDRLQGAKVMATDLRASAALVIGGLVAENTTEVSRVYHLDRGYELLEEKLRGLGADIKREKE
jgi:UDP-N-acetylglucosamine 1-carboxyvinyltransferase